MTATGNPVRLYTRRRDAYVRFIRFVGYRRGLSEFFMTSGLLKAGQRILDAGCGTGALTTAVADTLCRKGLKASALHGFDLTPAMLEHFRANADRKSLEGLELAQANVLDLEKLPDGWSGYDLVVSASMLEYVPRERFVDAIRGLRQRLKPGGTFVLFITRRNLAMRLVIGLWWAANLYSREELAEAFRAAGFSDIRSPPFPPAVANMSLWGHIVEAKRPESSD